MQLCRYKGGTFVTSAETCGSPLTVKSIRGSTDTWCHHSRYKSQNTKLGRARGTCLSFKLKKKVRATENSGPLIAGHVEKSGYWWDYLLTVIIFGDRSTLF